MDLAAVHSIYETLSGDKFVFLYSGSFHDEHTAQLIGMGEHFVTTAHGDRALRNKLGFLMVESYQNIIRHRVRLPDDLERGAGRSLYFVRQRGLSFQVVACNAIPNEELERLKELLKDVTNLDTKKLKEMFLTGLQNESRSRKGGAGLGLIEMARRSKHNLGYSMVPVGDHHQLFTLRILIGDEDMEKSSGPSIDGMHAHTVAQDILLLCKGHFTAGLDDSVLEMISKDLDEGAQRAETWSKGYVSAITLLQAIGLPEAEPMIIIGRHGKGHSLIACTVSDSTTVDRLLQELEILNKSEGAAAVSSEGLSDLAALKVAPMRSYRTKVGDKEFIAVETVV